MARRGALAPAAARASARGRARLLLGEPADASWADGLGPLLAAALVIGPLARAGSWAELRGLVFACAPLLLLAGFHARTSEYLHARARLRALPSPIPGEAHWIGARRRHGRGLLVTLGAGLLAIGGAWSWIALAHAGRAPGAAVDVAPAAGDVARWLALASDWLVVWGFAVLLEPAAMAASAALGQRLPPGSRTHDLQRQLAAGATYPEAAVHLYAPALACAAAAAVAMPVQLSVATWVEGPSFGRAPPGIGWIIGVCVLGAVALRAWAPRVYARHLWFAVPWLHQTMRTLAGPPRPEPAPRAFGRLDPVARLALLHGWRATPLPGVRLAAMLGWSSGLAAGWIERTGAAWAVALVLVALWLAPLQTIAAARTERARWCGPWPLPAAARAGRVPLAAALWLVPAGIAVALAILPALLSPLAMQPSP